MQIYYASLQAIDRQTRELELVTCSHCQRRHQLISHGFIYKKRRGGEPEAVGKRIFCSNRDKHTGCGRTSRLYLSAAIRHLHFMGAQVVAFVLALVAGSTVRLAYFAATGTAEPRHAYRWLNRLRAQLSTYRSLVHCATLVDGSIPARTGHSPRRGLFGSTFRTLLATFGTPLCSQYQCRLQRAFL